MKMKRKTEHAIYQMKNIQISLSMNLSRYFLLLPADIKFKLNFMQIFIFFSLNVHSYNEACNVPCYLIEDMSTYKTETEINFWQYSQEQWHCQWTSTSTILAGHLFNVKQNRKRIVRKEDKNKSFSCREPTQLEHKFCCSIIETKYAIRLSSCVFLKQHYFYQAINDNKFLWFVVYDFSEFFSIPFQFC